MNANTSKTAGIALFVALFGLLLALEMYCARLAYETIGEVVSSLYFLMIGINVILVILAYRYRTLAAIGVILLAIAIIPYQLHLGDRLIRVQAEASRIVTFVYTERINAGSFPPTLDGYEFDDPAMEQYIQSYHVGEEGNEFSLFYRVGTENTSHFYMSQTGWGYYPD
jgi:hypothetical protein